MVLLRNHPWVIGEGCALLIVQYGHWDDNGAAVADMLNFLNFDLLTTVA